jgi:hypothetical protein
MPLPSKTLILAGIALSALGAIAFIGSFPVMSYYEGKAVLAQRVEKDEAGALFDDPYRNIGSPQQFVIDDPKAFLPEKGEDGVALLSEDYLKEKGIYPTQLQSIRAIVNYSRMGAGALFVAGDVLLVFGLLRRRFGDQSAPATT